MTERARIEAYLRRLYGYALSLAGNHHQAEDLVQECAVRALTARNVPGVCFWRPSGPATSMSCR
ncbi:MAG: hypothetical protein CMM60_14700 [Rhodospirillaceae bacterium]|nr:hypothetical protein [Rhodospirillaceae bacterium]